MVHPSLLGGVSIYLISNAILFWIFSFNVYVGRAQVELVIRNTIRTEDTITDLLTIVFILLIPLSLIGWLTLEQLKWHTVILII